MHTAFPFLKHKAHKTDASFGSSNVSLWRWNLKMSEFRSPCKWYLTAIGSSTFEGRGFWGAISQLCGLNEAFGVMTGYIPHWLTQLRILWRKMRALRGEIIKYSFLIGITIEILMWYRIYWHFLEKINVGVITRCALIRKLQYKKSIQTA